MQLDPELKTNSARLNKRMEDEKAAREAQSSPSKPSGSGVIAIIVLLLLGVGLMWVYPGPQMRRESARQAELAIAEKERVRRNEDALRAQAALELQRRQDEEFAAASPVQLRELVTACRDAIQAKFAGSPYAVYFARYTAADLQPLINISLGFGTKTGRPSVLLDDYAFDAIDYNVKQLQDPEWRKFWNISFVIEHAVEAFSTKQYAAVFKCDVKGLTPTGPRETERMFF